MSTFATMVLASLPFLGQVAVFLLGPGLFAGFMLAARAAEAGEPIRFSHLTAALAQAPRPLIALGGTNLLVFAFALVVFAVGWGEELRKLVELAASPKPDAAVIEEALTRLALPTLLLTALLLPLAMANWFAPALIVFAGMGPGAALLTSLTASLRNFWPFAVFGVLLFLLDTLASLVLRGIAEVVAAALGMAAARLVAMILAFPVFCAFVALVLTSAYASYRDVFESQKRP
jgi:hypothetical protein